MRRKFYGFAAGLLAVTTFATTSRAEDAELAGLLDENIVTTASKVSEVGSTAPATSSVITAEQIRVFGIHTIGEAIDFLSLGATGASPSSGSGFGVRGVNIENDSSEHLLLLVDGHAVNDFMRGSAPIGYDAGIPMELVDHIELVLGPGSVLYGSNAMLGVVNVVTKRASAFNGVRVGLESDLPFSGRGFVGAGHAFTFLGQPSELTIAAEYRTSKGAGVFYEAQNAGIDPSTGKLARYGDGPLTGVWGGRKTENDILLEPAVFARFVRGDFEATVRASSNEATQPLGYAHFDDPVNRTTVRRFSADLRHHASLSSVVQVSTRLYVDSYEGSTTFETSVGKVCPYQGTSCMFSNIDRARWAGVEIQSTFDWFKDGSLVTLIGVDPRVRSGQAKTDTFVPDTNVPLSASTAIIDRTDGILGAFLQQTYKPVPWITLNGGLRLDYDARFDPVVSPRLAASVNVWRGGVLKGVYSQAFRAPSFNESYFAHPLQPVSDLQPERVRSMEVSIEQVVGAERLVFGVFKSTVTNLVQQHTFTSAEAADYVQSGKSVLAPLYQYRNDDRVENFGFNAGFEGSAFATKLRYGTNITGARSRNFDSDGGQGEPLTTAPRLFGNARVSYALPSGLPTVGVAGLYASKSPVQSSYEAGYPGIPYAPPQVTVRATLSGDAPWVKGLSYRISANYMFADRSNALVGPLTEYSASHPTPSLQPTTQFVTTVGLQYAF